MDLKREIVCEYLKRPIPEYVLAERYGLSKPTITKILSSFGTKRWSRAQIFSPDLAEDYFRRIDSYTKAYLVGFFTVDGCVFWKNAKSAFLRMELKDSDKYILEKLLAETRCNTKLVYSQRSKTYTATIHSKQMVQDLQQYNIEPRSSRTQRMATNIPDEYMGSYLRGVFDGDGSYAFYRRRNRSVHQKAVRLCSGSELFVRDVSEFLSARLGVNIPTIQTGEDNTYSISWQRNNDIEAIIEYLYKDEGVCLVRKRDIAIKICHEIRQYRDNRHTAAS